VRVVTAVNPPRRGKPGESETSDRQPAAVPLAARRRPHRVGEVRPLAGDAGVAERRVQGPASRAHERLALPVLTVAGLLADQDDSGVGRAVAEYRPGGPLVQIAALAAERGPPKRRKVAGARDERRGGRVPVQVSHMDHHLESRREVARQTVTNLVSADWLPADTDLLRPATLTSGA
jgi:hypothetical protein